MQRMAGLSPELRGSCLIEFYALNIDFSPIEPEVIAMTKSFLKWLVLLFAVPSAVYADEQNMVVEVVSCVNSANGYPNPLGAATWELEQAVLELSSGLEKVSLAPDFHFVGGRKLGWHGTWVAFLKLSDDEKVAFETRPEPDSFRVFGESYVPEKVVAAFEECGIDWGGYWHDDYPFIEQVSGQKVQVPLFGNSAFDAKNLLPPKSAFTSDD